MTTTSERGFDRLICAFITGTPCKPGCSSNHVAEPGLSYCGSGYFRGDPGDYDREYCVDLIH